MCVLVQGGDSPGCAAWSPKYTSCAAEQPPQQYPQYCHCSNEAARSCACGLIGVYHLVIVCKCGARLLFGGKLRR